MQIVEIILLTCFLGTSSVIDILQKKINMHICIIFALIGVLFKSIVSKESVLEIFCGCVIGIIIYLLSVITKESIGKGDAITMGVVGIYMGLIDSCIIFAYSLFLVAIVGMFIMIVQKKGRKYRVAFIPFIAVSFLFISILERV